MIEYRPFHNTDPPRILALWNACELGRGAAQGITADAFEMINFSQPFFDREGLILAQDGERVIGMIHVGFGTEPSERTLMLRDGVICAILVDPDYQDQGVGRQLVARGEQFLKSCGAREVYAGPAYPRDPFFFGLYGGTQPAGFLESDAKAAPFFTAIGYTPVERRAVFQRELTDTTDPVNMRLNSVRRQTRLEIGHNPDGATWWWVTRVGRLDCVQFLLVPNDGSPPVASATVIGLDAYLAAWNARAIGVTDLVVPEAYRRQGYAQALLVEICRRMRSELVNLIEFHALEDDPGCMRLAESAGFSHVDTGVVYHRALG